MVDSHSAERTSELWLESAVDKWRGGLIKSFVKAILAGMLLSFGAMMFLVVAGGSGGLAAENPGLVKMLSAGVFPIGIIMIVMTGTELLTSNMAIFILSAVKRRTPWWSYPANLTVVFFGNLIGSLLVGGLCGHATGIFEADPYNAYIHKFTLLKVVHPTWSNILCRAISCNFLVCIAVFMGTSAREVVSKIFALWCPIFLFVGLGFDHVVANMLFVPLGIMLGAEVSVGTYIWKSMIPAFLGNAIGAAFLAFPLIYFYLLEEDTLPLTAPAVTIDSAGSSQKGE